jgi:hypothetical protein
MSIRIPLNQIVTSKYTIGKEFMYESTYKEYQGFYYEFNNKIFAGKEFSFDSPSLIGINSDNVNILKSNPETQRYSISSNQKIYKEEKIIGLPYSDFDNLYDKSGNLFLKFFCKKVDSNPIIIKNIDEDTYKKLFGSTLYYITYIGEYNGVYQNIDEANIKMSGLSDFLLERNLS